MEELLHIKNGCYKVFPKYRQKNTLGNIKKKNEG